MKNKIFSLALIICSPYVYADYKDDIGFSQLQADLGTSTPNAAGISVTQVEAAVGASNTNVGAWTADFSSSEFSGKTLTDLSNPTSNGTSSHATGVGRSFYGNSSIASGITNIHAYSAANWLNDLTLISNETNRVVNHSWIGTLPSNPTASDIAEISTILKRVDQTVEENEIIQVAALNNGISSTPPPLLASAYNSIAVGRTDGLHTNGSAALDSTYIAGRIRPDLVIPKGTTSGATPVVSAAAAILLDQASSTTNGERSEVVKAVMMAGADRNTNNTTAAQINNYRTDISNQTANGLDNRYGAGQLNVYNNYQIMDAGEQDSFEDGGNTTVGSIGYDYDASFGGQGGSNNSASYFFETTQSENLELTASLVWNIDIAQTSNNATLHNLDLLLYDVTSGANILLANSNSDIDNTENIWFFLEQNHDYKLEVIAADGTTFNWDYGLAWKITPVPIPSAIWFFISGLFGLFRIRKKTN